MPNMQLSSHVEFMGIEDKLIIKQLTVSYLFQGSEREKSRRRVVRASQAKSLVMIFKLCAIRKEKKLPMLREANVTLVILIYLK